MDDQTAVRTVAGYMLGSLGYEVEFAENGEQAVEIYSAAREMGRPFDAVILDLTIRGGMGGKDTIRTLAEIDPAVRAAVSSGYSDDDTLSNYRDFGFQAVLSKPYQIEELSRVLHELLLQRKSVLKDFRMTDEKSKLVYSTDRLVSGKERPGGDNAKPALNPAQQKSALQPECDCPARTEAEGRKVCYSNRGPADSGKRQGALLRQLKTGLGTGGTLKDESLEIQGDHRDALISALTKMGYNPKRSGG